MITLFVLLSEADAAHRQTLRAAFEQLGHRVDEVDGAAAADTISESAYDIALTDRSGTELTRRLRETMPRALLPHLDSVTAPVVSVIEQTLHRATHLDEETVEGLEVITDGAADELLEELFEGTAKSLETMERAGDDHDTIQRSAHSLVGSAGVCGAFGIARTCMGIERSTARGRHDEARVRIAVLREIFEATLAHRAR